MHLGFPVKVGQIWVGVGWFKERPEVHLLGKYINMYEKKGHAVSELTYRFGDFFDECRFADTDVAFQHNDLRWM